MLIENLIYAVTEDIMRDAAHAMGSPEFSNGKFAVACRAQGADLRAVVQRITREEADREYEDNDLAIYLLNYSDMSREMGRWTLIRDVVKRLVSLAGTP